VEEGKLPAQREALRQWAQMQQTPWQGAMQSIRSHFWFGSGFGTTDNGQDASAQVGQYNGFATSEAVTSENGSSYLSIVSWVFSISLASSASLAASRIIS
jgi:hypothetical protein